MTLYNYTMFKSLLNFIKSPRWVILSIMGALAVAALISNIANPALWEIVSFFGYIAGVIYIILAFIYDTWNPVKLVNDFFDSIDDLDNCY